MALNDLYDYVLHQLRPSGQIPQRSVAQGVNDVLIARVHQPSTHTPPPPTGRAVLSISTDEIDLDNVGPDEVLPAEIVDVFNAAAANWTGRSPPRRTGSTWSHKPGSSGSPCTHARGVNRANVVVRDRRRGGSQTLRVRVQVRSEPTAPRLVLSEHEIDFGVLSHRTKSPQRTIRLHNTGGGQLNPTARATDPRILQRQLGDTLELQVDTTVIGRLAGDVLVSSNGGDAAFGSERW